MLLCPTPNNQPCSVSLPFLGIQGMSPSHYIDSVYLNEPKSTQVYDFREFAGAAASTDMFINNPKESTYGGKAIAVVRSRLLSIK